MLANRRILNSWTRPASLIGLSLAMLAWLVTLSPQLDPDFWWHLRVAREMLDSGQIPHHSTISWLAAGPWHAHSWANEILLYWSYQLGGLPGTSLLFGILSGACLVLVASIVRVMRPGMGMIAIGGLVLLASVVALAIWLPRAQMWDAFFCLFAVYGWQAYRYRGDRRGLLLMPVMMLAWVNLHGAGVMMYGALLVGLFAGQLFDQRSGWRLVNPRPLIYSAALTLLAIVINPYGLAMYVYPFETILNPVQLTSITEWRSPDFQDPALRPTQIYLAIALGLLALIRLRDGVAICVSVGLLFLTLQSVRYLGIAGPLSVALLGSGLVSAGTLLAQRLLPRLHRPILLERRSFPLSVLITLALAVVVLARLATLSSPFQDDQVAASQPTAATEWLVANPQSGRLFNVYGWGGYLAAHQPGQVGLYGAADAFSSATLAQAIAVAQTQIDPRGPFDEWGVMTVVYHSDAPLAFWLSEADEWSEAYRDEQAVIFIRHPSGD